jgi:hypothetical protein
MATRVLHHRLVLSTAVVGLILAASAPAAAVHHDFPPDDVSVVKSAGVADVNVGVSFSAGTDLPGPLETTVENRTTINDEGLPAEKKKK